jgi:hypothetical protein
MIILFFIYFKRKNININIEINSYFLNSIFYKIILIKIINKILVILDGNKKFLLEYLLRIFKAMKNSYL